MQYSKQHGNSYHATMLEMYHYWGSLQIPPLQPEQLASPQCKKRFVLYFMNLSKKEKLLFSHSIAMNTEKMQKMASSIYEEWKRKQKHQDESPVSFACAWKKLTVGEQKEYLYSFEILEEEQLEQTQFTLKYLRKLEKIIASWAIDWVIRHPEAGIDYSVLLLDKGTGGDYFDAAIDAELDRLQQQLEDGTFQAPASPPAPSLPPAPRQERS